MAAMYKVLKCSRSQIAEQRRSFCHKSIWTVRVISSRICLTMSVVRNWWNNGSIKTSCFEQSAHLSIMLTKLFWKKAIFKSGGSRRNSGDWMRETSFSEDDSCMWNYLRASWKRNKIRTRTRYWLASKDGIRTLQKTNIAEHKSCSHANNKGQHGPNRWTLYVNKVRLY